MTNERIGDYRIIRKLGEGGMGVVYEAEDSKLERRVALKTLSERFTEDPERIARLQREARTLASLQHPNVAVIFGLEEADDQHFLVMELVEGENLAEHLRRGTVPLDEALQLSVQIAEGLEAAHEKGVVHRDLKPGNVRVTPEGKAKILDFGLARSYQGETTAGSDIGDSPTVTVEMTKEGVLLGTAPYMSPEQARGKRVDWRSDIWAFGCILYELLTGRPAFPGETVTDTLTLILEREPDWECLPKSIPPRIRRLLKRCLTKDIRNRLQAIGDARIAIQESLAEPAAEIEETVALWPVWRHVALWILLPLVAIGAWIMKPTETPVPVPTLRFEIPLPEGERLASYYRHGLAITPDGRTLAFVSGTTSHPWLFPDTTQIYLRSLDQRQARPVPGTENGIQPFFSPNGKWLGFVRGNQLMKVAVAGGEPVALCECRTGYGASWGPNGTIIFAGSLGGLRQVSVSGGEPDTLTQLDQESGEISHRLPHFLPDGKAVLFTALRYKTTSPDWSRACIYAQSLVTGERKLLIEGGTDARYLSTGHLVFAREGKLVAVRFDPDRLEVTGQETPVLDGVSHSIHACNSGRETGAAHFTVSAIGVLAYVAGTVYPETKNDVVWIDRQGQEEPLGVEPKSYLSVRVSHDGLRVLLTGNYPPADVWLWDLERKMQSRQTFEGHNGWAIWGPGPDCFTVASDHEGPRLVYRKTIDSGPGYIEKLPVQAEALQGASSWSPEGEELAIQVHGGKTGHDILIFKSEGQTEPFLHTRYCKHSPEFSPDGRWLVYSSDESGQEEVYVRPYPGPGRAVQISARGGERPAWSRDGREVFYRKDDESDMTKDAFYSVRLHVDGDRVTPGQPEKLFEGNYQGSTPLRSYDVAPDGRFLLIKGSGKPSDSTVIEELFPTSIQVVQNWFAELEEKLPEDE